MYNDKVVDIIMKELEFIHCHNCTHYNDLIICNACRINLSKWACSFEQARHIAHLIANLED